MIPAETISSGAPATCDDCGVTVKLEVLSSGGGYYVGSRCNCGPYSRESEYFPTFSAAERALASGEYGR